MFSKNGHEPHLEALPRSDDTDAIKYFRGKLYICKKQTEILDVTATC